ncbi:MAG TPA: SMP-30/gluconolactonase/LRE family protein [Actinomycetales bacterium]|jgi:sugar lactone lactonase YvrE
MVTLEQLGPPLAQHGEGPVWDAGAGRLLMVDIPAGEVLTYDPRSGEPPARTRIGGSVGALRARAGGGLVAGVGTGFALVSPTGDVQTLDPLWPDADVRMNDGACDAQGRFWCGSMGEGAEEGRGVLWRLDPDGTTTSVLTDLTIPNGLVFDDDGTRALFVDSPTRRVDVLHLDDGRVVGREPWTDVQVGDGVPDGICRDAEGGLWVAVHGGSAVVRFDGSGRLDQVLELPTARPTACTFGGADLDVLYVTTSAVDAEPHEAGSAGALFATRPGVRGVPAALFAG